jgi:hypothetical protein
MSSAFVAALLATLAPAAVHGAPGIILSASASTSTSTSTTVAECPITLKLTSQNGSITPGAGASRTLSLELLPSITSCTAVPESLTAVLAPSPGWLTALISCDSLVGNGGSESFYWKTSTFQSSFTDVDVVGSPAASQWTFVDETSGAVVATSSLAWDPVDDPNFFGTCESTNGSSWIQLIGELAYVQVS